MKNFQISIRSYGMHAILIEWPNEVNEKILDDILDFRDYLKLGHLDPREWEMVPAYNSLTLICEGYPIDFEIFAPQLKSLYEKERTKGIVTQKYLWKLPVCYDLNFGIDLAEISQKLQKTIPEIIDEHTKHIYTVYGIGFLPGFMYLGGIPESLEIARKETPRLMVEKGAVGLAGKQTGIYPQESPGGWNIIGNCPVPLFDPNSELPCFVSVGDKIQFHSISKSEYDLYKIENEVGIYKLEKIKINA